MNRTVRKAAITLTFLATLLAPTSQRQEKTFARREFFQLSPIEKLFEGIGDSHAKSWESTGLCYLRFFEHFIGDNQGVLLTDLGRFSSEASRYEMSVFPYASQFACVQAKQGYRERAAEIRKIASEFHSLGMTCFSRFPPYVLEEAYLSSKFGVQGREKLAVYEVASYEKNGAYEMLLGNIQALMAHGYRIILSQAGSDTEAVARMANFGKLSPAEVAPDLMNAFGPDRRGMAPDSGSDCVLIICSHGDLPGLKFGGEMPVSIVDSAGASALMANLSWGGALLPPPKSIFTLRQGEEEDICNTRNEPVQTVRRLEDGIYYFRTVKNDHAGLTISDSLLIKRVRMPDYRLGILLSCCTGCTLYDGHHNEKKFFGSLNMANCLSRMTGIFFLAPPFDTATDEFIYDEKGMVAGARHEISVPVSFLNTVRAVLNMVEEKFSSRLFTPNGAASTAEQEYFKNHPGDRLLRRE
jgi:hypothetical protein